MKKPTLILSIISATLLTGCFESDTERGMVGAASGAVIASTTGGDPLVGGLIGGAAGVVCDDLGVC